MFCSLTWLQRTTRRYPHLALAHVGAKQQDAVLLIDEKHAGGEAEDWRSFRTPRESSRRRPVILQRGP